MIRSLRRRRAVLVRSVALIASTAALLAFGSGCEEDTQPVITKIAGNPLCGAMTPQQPDSSLGLRVQFFARASSGNRFDDPTGANSALDWFWDFNGDGRVDAQNVVEPSFVYQQAGDYQVTLTVQDSDGDEDSRSLLVQVRSQSAELDILEFDAEVRSSVVFDTELGDNTGVTLEGEIPPIAELPLADRVVEADQPVFDGWEAVFDGRLTDSCEITDIFNQYSWRWGFSDGTEVLDTNPVRLTRSADEFEPITGVVSVTEVVTGIRRTDAVETVLPVGVSISNPLYAYVAPGARDSMDVDVQLLPAGLDRIEMRIEYDPTLTLEDVATGGVLVERGFSTSRSDSATFLDLTFETDTPLPENVTETRVARLYFRNAPEALDVPRERPVRVRRFLAVRDTTRLPTNLAEARLNADVADCNENGLGDTMELLARATYVDRQTDGTIDYCFDCNDNGAPDGDEIAGDSTVDVDVNGIPDDCDCNSDGLYDTNQLADGQVPDDDQNGIPDDCDCDWNGIPDLFEIRDADDFVQRFTADLPESLQVLETVPYNRAFDYRVSLDQIDADPDNDALGATPDGILDFCQDCDDNGVLDRLQYTIGGTSEDVLAAVRSDVDGNLVLDECDCNGNNRFDRGEIERGFATATDGLIDECDCNDNAQNDLVEIGDAIFDIQITATAVIYTSSLDGNRDQVIDGCADCDDNGRRDGEDFDLGGPLTDLDANFLLDRCDCNGDEAYDPPLDTLTNDLDANGVIDLCDCDRNAVADLEQISNTVTDFTLNSFGRVDDYTSPEDAFTVVDENDDDPRTPWVDVELVPGPDRVPDLCQDCNANGVADRQEVSEEPAGQFPNRDDLDRDGRLDECDCDLNGLFDVVEIELNPSLDADDDGIIDECDCNDNGRIDVVEIAEFAVFDGDTGIYLRADGTNDLGQDIVDLNGNGVLDECEAAARANPWSGERAETIRAGRR